MGKVYEFSKRGPIRKGPFIEWAQPSLDAGWGPFPLPPGKKKPPPKHVTGEDGFIPEQEHIDDWIRTAPNGANMGWRLPRDIIGIDVDDYGEKSGGATFEKFKAEASSESELPPTWVITARSDGVSGIRLYRIPEKYQDMAWPGKIPGSGIEILQYRHRYIFAPYSIHPELKTPVRNYPPEAAERGRLDGESWVEELVVKDDLPFLPDEFCEFITNGKFAKYLPKIKGSVTVKDVNSFLRARPGGSPCRVMRNTTARFIKYIEDNEGSAHENMRDGVYCLFRMAVEGHSGVKTATAQLRKAFIKELTETRRERRNAGKSAGRVLSEAEAKEEISKSFFGALRIVLKAMENEPESTFTECWCLDDDDIPDDAEADSRGRVPREPSAYRLTEVGNAQQLDDIYGDNLRYVPGWKTWVKWDGKRWIMGAEGEAARYAEAVADRIIRAGERLIEYGTQAGQDDKVERGKQLKAWGLRCESNARVNGVVSRFADRPGITVDAAAFNANPALVNCSDGVIELGFDDNGVKYRNASRDDMCSVSTGVPYVPWEAIRPGEKGAHLISAKKRWDNYLELFLPDKKVRAFVQKIMGYSLYGSNDEQIMCFLLGPPASGKSTFLEAIMGALGDYAGSFSLGLLREKQEPSAPNSELLRAMNQRIITAAEGGEWHLHADRIKNVTGGERLSARAVHSSVIVDRVPAFTPFVSTNSSPTIARADDALWRRLVVLPFDISLTNGDPKLKSKLDSAARGILRDALDSRSVVLSWLVEGWRAYAREGLERIEDQPLAVAEATLKFREGVSDFHEFLADCCQREPGINTSFANAYRLYDAWCDYNRVKERDRLGKSQFSMRLKSNGFETARIRKPNSESKYNVIRGMKIIRGLDDMNDDVVRVTLDDESHPDSDRLGEEIDNVFRNNE